MWRCRVKIALLSVWHEWEILKHVGEDHNYKCFVIGVFFFVLIAAVNTETSNLWHCMSDFSCHTCLCCRGRYDNRGGGHEADRATPGSSVDHEGSCLIVVGCRGQDWVAWEGESEREKDRKTSQLLQNWYRFVGIFINANFSSCSCYCKCFESSLSLAIK